MYKISRIEVISMMASSNKIIRRSVVCYPNADFYVFKESVQQQSVKTEENGT